jgi:hypothetical protein
MSPRAPLRPPRTRRDSLDTGGSRPASETGGSRPASFSDGAANAASDAAGQQRWAAMRAERARRTWVQDADLATAFYSALGGGPVGGLRRCPGLTA